MLLQDEYEQESRVMQLIYCLALMLALTMVVPVLQASEKLASQPATAAGVDGSVPEEKPDRSPRVPTFPVKGDLAGELQVFTTAYEDTFAGVGNDRRSEEHTSELQSRENVVSRLLLEEKKIAS